MSTNLEVKEFTCGHTQSPTSRRTSRAYQTLPNPSRCLSCVCYTILEATNGPISAIPRSYLRDLDAHMAILNATISKSLRLQIWLLDQKLKDVDNIEGFRNAVVDLAGYPEANMHFGI
ncbi:hypothetical protein F4678DRAFT_464195 [Xylaria arbuscula]|nr:hypothetical protein F4678DRAFT_464195 [Xylaria arbuscula]